MSDQTNTHAPAHEGVLTAEQEIDAIMEQAQVFASAWAFLGGPFDNGSGLETAERERASLRALLSKLRAPVADERAVHPEIRAALAMLDVPVLGYLGSHSGKLTPSADKVDNFESAISLVSESAHRAACEKIIAALASAPVAGEAQRLYTEDEVPAKMVDALRAAMEGECDGLDLRSQQARNILAYLLNEGEIHAAPQASAETQNGKRYLAIREGSRYVVAHGLLSAEMLPVAGETLDRLADAAVAAIAVDAAPQASEAVRQQRAGDADERAAFEAWWGENMNVEELDLARTEYPMTEPEDQQYLCWETNRGWMTWKGCAAHRLPLVATREMCKAADGIGGLYACNAGEVWEAMVDAALSAQPGAQKYWLCCGSKDPNHSNRRAPDCFNADKTKWGTADQHSAAQMKGGGDAN